jgi:hypothetical protein
VGAERLVSRANGAAAASRGRAARLARWALPALSLLAVLAFTWLDLRGARTGPGPLHPAHAAVAALERGARCEQCHREGQGVDAQRCTSCHAAIGAQRAAGTGLHGALEPALLARCEACHSEHHGDELPLLAPHAWARAGVPDAARYDHRDVPFALTGAHEALPCARCHRDAEAAAPPPGGRFLGLSQRCTTCHDDAHADAFGGDCASCHGQQQEWRAVPHFAHDALALSGAHARTACARCHEAGSGRAVAALRAAPGALQARTCAGCHADPHGAGATVAALRLPAAATADCTRCHDASVWREHCFNAAAHAAAGYPLLGAHTRAGCAACHGDAERAPRWRGAAPAADDCASCHEHPHGAPLLAAAASCAPCHGAADASFGDGRITAAQHAALGFALAPPHGDVACTSCHAGDARAQRFPGRSADDCRACHRDPHAGQFAHEARWQQCTGCHASTHFRPHAFGVAAHAATGFPLDGAHGAVGCDRCHADVRGGVRRFHGTPRACASCHRDPHAGTFDRPGRPRTVDGRDGCARCHDTNAFAPVASFDHARWTGHALDGAHRALACDACHAPGGGGPGMARLGRAAGTACAACHHDPHAGQFARDRATDCTRCHEQASWRTLRFDHARDSRFALDATHAALACSACHRAQDGVVRYTPLGTKCGDCHRLGPGGEVRK